MQTYYAFPFHILLSANENAIRRGEVSLIRSNRNTILIAYANHVYKTVKNLTPIEQDNLSASICMMELNTYGKPIRDEWVVVPLPENTLNVMSPGLRRLPNNQLGMVYSKRESTTQAKRLFIQSNDEGQTWSEPTIVAQGGYVTGGYDRFNVLSSGRLLAPLHFCNDWDAHYLSAMVAYSDDFGKTWAQSNTLTLPRVGTLYGPYGEFIESGCVEPIIVERADGILVMAIRTAMGTLFTSQSENQGVIWSDPKSMEVVSPQAPAHLSRIPMTDKLLLVWTSDYDIRENMHGKRNIISACVSDDGGNTWLHKNRKILVHDLNHAIDYPTVFYTDDEIWLLLRFSSTPRILEGYTSTGLMRIPLHFFL